MKDKFGIEICRDNCTGDLIPPHDCPKRGQKRCGKKNCEYFMPKPKLLKARLLELQKELRLKLKQKKDAKRK